MNPLMQSRALTYIVAYTASSAWEAWHIEMYYVTSCSCITILADAQLHDWGGVPDQHGEGVLPWGLFSSLRLPREGGCVSSLPPMPVGLSSGEESGGELASSSRAWSFNREPCRQKQNMPTRYRQKHWGRWRGDWAIRRVSDAGM